MRKTRTTAIDELVPLAERLQYLQVVRLAMVGAFVAFVATVAEARSVSLSEIRSVVVAYALGTTLAHALWRVSGRRNIALFGSVLIVDGVFLAWASWATGGAAGPMRYLALVHLVTTALLASYRTAVKLAVWHSLLAVIVLHAQQVEFLPGSRGSLPGTDFQHLVVFLGLAWAATVTTATFAAVNERELRRRKVDLEDLARLARSLEHATTPEAVARTLAHALVDACGFGRAVVVAVDEGEVLALAGGPPGPDEWRHGVERTDAVLVEAWAAHETKLVVDLDPVANPRLSELLVGARNLLVVPLSAEGHVVGAVVAEHGLRRGSRIERRVVTMVDRFCDHAALAMRTATLLEQLRTVAATDGLTGVANRRAFEEAMVRELARSGRTGDPMSLVMVDIDHFKSLNDRYGHQTGDAVLRAVATGLVRGCRVVDLVSRYGGEEFAIVLPNCSTEHAVELAERLRAGLAVLDLGMVVTASFGVATCPFDGADRDSLIAAADAALYQAKHLGRDRVVVASNADVGSGISPSRRRREHPSAR